MDAFAQRMDTFAQRTARPTENPAAATVGRVVITDRPRGEIRAAAAESTDTVTAAEHEARLDDLDQMHRRQIVSAGARIAATKKALRAAQTEFEAEQEALERRWHAAVAEGEAAIETDERLAAKCRAFLGE